MTSSALPATANPELPRVRIDLDPVVDSDRLLSGELSGAEARQRLDLASHDDGDYLVDIFVPYRVIAANSSFLREFIRPSILRLGLEAFAAKYRFSGRDISEDLREEMRRAAVELARQERRAA